MKLQFSANIVPWCQFDLIFLRMDGLLMKKTRRSYINGFLTTPSRRQRLLQSRSRGSYCVLDPILNTAAGWQAAFFSRSRWSVELIAEQNRTAVVGKTSPVYIQGVWLSSATPVHCCPPVLPSPASTIKHDSLLNRLVFPFVHLSQQMVCRVMWSHFTHWQKVRSAVGHNTTFPQ